MTILGIAIIAMVVLTMLDRPRWRDAERRRRKHHDRWI